MVQKLFWKTFGKLFNYINVKKYTEKYVKYLKNEGIKIDGLPNYISPEAYFDTQKNAVISLGEGVVISKEVMILTHDYSIARGIQAVKGKTWASKHTPRFEKSVFIGDNSFIGARSVILPGSHIGKNCIIGAGSVVRGTIDDNSIAIGNPAMVVSNTLDWATKHIDMGDYLE